MENVVVWLGIEWKAIPGKETWRKRKQIIEENDNEKGFLKMKKEERGEKWGRYKQSEEKE